jgi:hypothetical protein
MLLHLIRRSADGDARKSPKPGWVLAHEVPATDGQGSWAKGHVLTPSDLPRLRSAAWDELHLIEREAGDVHEQEAGLRIARAAAGPGVEVGTLATAHWPLIASHRGVLRIATDALTAVNDVVGACVYTRFDGQVVDTGVIIARAKVAPLVLPAHAVVAAERIAQRAGGLARVAEFQPTRVGVVVQERLDERAAARFTAALAGKIKWFGSELLTPIFARPAPSAIAHALTRTGEAGATVVLMAGMKSLDPLDPAFIALDQLGIKLDRFGVPIHPGSLFWLAHWGERVVLGVPTCGLFSQLTSFDLILPRVLAREAVTSHALSALGHGGLLPRDVSFFPPYGGEVTGDRKEGDW